MHCSIQAVGPRSRLSSFDYPGPDRNVAGHLRRIGGSSLEFSSPQRDHFCFPAPPAWRGAVASCAVNLAFAVQADSVFLHAASVAIDGRAVVLVGRKCAGKSTTAMSLAARGHALLGDEICALRPATREALPVPRTLSLREGPRSTRLAARLRGVRGVRERYPDGSLRMRYRPSALFPMVAPSPVPLGAIFFLQGLGELTRAERFAPTFEHVKMLEPLGSDLWSEPAVARRFQLLRLLSGTPCHHLHLGPPDECAEAIERLLEDL